MITFTQKGDFSKTDNFLRRSINTVRIGDLEKYGQEGVVALSAATPVDSGKTANSWSYKIERTKGRTTISWLNSNVVNGVPIAIILQYGHGTKNGGFVQGRDYINPVMKPIFDELANSAWREVTKL